jgi:hypothetical protein
MKAISCLIAVTCLLGAPLIATAGEADATTHASKVAELKALEKAGYNPSQSCPCYPQDLQVATDMGNNESRIAKGDDAPKATLSEAQR